MMRRTPDILDESVTDLNALLIPRERPPDLLEIKKALLSFERLFLFEADDREVIPPAALFLAASGGLMPIGVHVNAVMPLGKAPGFTEEFEQVAAAIEFGKSEGVIVTITPPPDLTGRLYIGNVPLGPDTPNPTFVLSVLRHVATDQELLNDAVATAVPLAGLTSNDLDALAPNGSGHQEINTLPSPVVYAGPVPSEELREVVTRLARARLGSIVRSLAVSHIKQLQPIADDPGIAAAVRRLTRNLQSAQELLEQGTEERLILDRLGRLHRIMLGETIAEERLRSMSLEDVLRLRTDAWGRSQEHRQRLLRDLRQIALEETTADRFERRCDEELRTYRNVRMQLGQEWANLRIKIECTIGATLAGAGSGVIQNVLGTGSLETLLVVGGVLMRFGAAYIPEIRNRAQAERQFRSSVGYGLATPYRDLVR